MVNVEDWNELTQGCKSLGCHGSAEGVDVDNLELDSSQGSWHDHRLAIHSRWFGIRFDSFRLELQKRRIICFNEDQVRLGVINGQARTGSALGWNVIADLGNRSRSSACANHFVDVDADLAQFMIGSEKAIGFKVEDFGLDRLIYGPSFLSVPSNGRVLFDSLGMKLVSHELTSSSSNAVVMMSAEELGAVAELEDGRIDHFCCQDSVGFEEAVSERVVYRFVGDDSSALMRLLGFIDQECFVISLDS